MYCLCDSLCTPANCSSCVFLQYKCLEIIHNGDQNTGHDSGLFSNVDLKLQFEMLHLFMKLQNEKYDFVV